mgnify:CR=1 FL=1
MAEYCKKQEAISRTITGNSSKKTKQNSGHISDIVQRVITMEGKSLDFSSVCKELKINQSLFQQIKPYIEELITSERYYHINDIYPYVDNLLLFLKLRNGQSQSTSSAHGFNDISKNLELEDAMGTLLLEDGYVLNAATQIHSNLSLIHGNMDEKIAIKACIPAKEGALPHTHFWAGADSFVQDYYHPKQNLKTVDGEVYAATQYEEAMMSTEWRKNYPSNSVLAMRNMIPNFSFDMAIEDSEPYMWQEKDKANLYAAYLHFPIFGNKKQNEFISILSSHSKDERKKIMSQIHIRESRSTNLAGDNSSSISSMTNMESGYRQSYSGRQYNLITFKPYEDNANSLKKPTLSGPSGTAFRFIYAYACLITSKGISTPSIQDALLVTMANLLPPNGHHSYHEIMDGVHGVGGLKYTDHAGYTDICNIPKGKDIYDNAYFIVCRKYCPSPSFNSDQIKMVLGATPNDRYPTNEQNSSRTNQQPGERYLSQNQAQTFALRNNFDQTRRNILGL